GSRQHYQAIRNRLETEPNVVNISGLQDRPSYIGSSSSYAKWEGKDPNDSPTIGNFRADYDLIKTMKIELIDGRDFSREFPTDIRKRFLVNEEMVRIMGMDNVLGKRLMYSGDEGTIIGVVKDFHYMPLRAPMRPLVIRLIPEEVQVVLVRIDPDYISETVESLRNKWKEVVPAFPFEYYFLEDDFEWMYTNERRAGNIFRSFSLIAIVIACLGIFGLASYTAEQRTKECGVRKVLGASISSIMNLLTKEFIILVLLANIAAYPLSYYIMSKWLELFAYRTDIGILVMLGASVIALIITAITVGLQAFKAARANPVESLRYE
ncbi:MAG: hypothetical protein GY863_08840, partial [bacterium]|nr:hypothetical protein [bacterium]